MGRLRAAADGRGRRRTEGATSTTKPLHAGGESSSDLSAMPALQAAGCIVACTQAPGGGAPKAGQLMRNEDLAATFRSLAAHGAAKGAPSSC